MASMGDLGRELARLREDPQPLHPKTELDKLEARLHEFVAWASGRSDREIRSRFASEFTSEPLHDEVVTAMSEGRGTEVRHRLPVSPPA